MYVTDQIEKLFEEKRDDYIRIYKSRAGANDVEDLLQEAFYRALYYSDSYDENLVPLETWFGGIIENCLKDLCREKRNGSSMHEKLTPESAIVEHRYPDGFTKTLSKEIGKKKGDHKYTLYLYFMCGYELQEIQRVLKISYLTINSSIVRFKEYLRSAYPEYAEE